MCGRHSMRLDEEAAERAFVAYAWPDAGARFAHGFFLDQNENIQTLPMTNVALSCDSARGPGARTDWTAWRGKRPRPGPLPGDRR
ncbi:MAG: hypothetical protein ABI895_36225 [Deltaproteobacteria bacterium]